MGLTSEQKGEIFKEYAGSEKNTGSTEGQIAMLTANINDISSHLKSNKKDFSTQRSLLKKVGQRKKLLKYLAHKDLEAYRAIIEKLNLRK